MDVELGRGQQLTIPERLPERGTILLPVTVLLSRSYENDIPVSDRRSKDEDELYTEAELA